MKKLFLIVTFMLLIPTIVHADTGPKPTITVRLKNIEGTKYKIDLLSDCSNQKEKIVDMYSDYKNEPIYKYHEGNWYATTLRNFLLHGEVEGNKKHEHKFTYFGVPTEFKVIVQMNDGTIRVSDTIKRSGLNYKVLVDVNTMKVIKTRSNTIGGFIKILLITIIIELVLAILFNTKKYHVIVITNLITNTLLQLSMLKLKSSMEAIVILIIFEICIFFVEYLVYLRFINNIDNRKKFFYTLAANLSTALLTFII